MKERNVASDRFGASLKTSRQESHGVRMRGLWSVSCYGPDGALKWEDNFENLVVNAGLDHLLDVTLSGGAQDTTWFVGLTDSTPTVAAADTMASHAGWVEIQTYSEATRPAWVDGGVSAQSVSNSGSQAAFSINGAATVGGAFLCGDNVKGGTTGVLYAAGAFSGGDKTLGNGDTLNVTATFTSADDGV